MISADKLVLRLQRVAEWMRSVRSVLLFAGAALFVAGLWWSLGNLPISVADVRPGLLALSLLVVMPLSLLYSAVGFQIIARTSGLRVPLGKATSIACYASLAELLPLPGGAVVRSAALVADGIGVVRSIALVTANAILWIALAAVGAGSVVLPYSTFIGTGLLAAGGLGLIAVLAWLWWKAGVRNAFFSLVHRMAGVALLSFRLVCSFATIGVALSLVKALPFTFSLIAGSAASITPSGLGISEALGAVMAEVVQVAPAAAFLAVALDRLLFIVASGVGVLVAHSISALNSTPAPSGSAPLS